MLHIQNEAAKMVADWAANGFNGVDFHECRMEPTLLQDWLDDGLTEEAYEQFIEGYAIFIASPDLYVEIYSTHPYATNEVNVHRFFADLESEMRRRLGDDITIRRSEACDEFEVERISRGEFQDRTIRGE